MPSSWNRKAVEALTTRHSLRIPKNRKLLIKSSFLKARTVRNSIHTHTLSHQNFKPTFSSLVCCHLLMAPYQRSANETFAVHNLVASTTKSITDATTTSVRPASLQPASNRTSIFQPNSHAGSSLDPSSIQNVTFGVLAMVIGIGGLILAYAQLRKMRLTDMILERIKNS